MPFTQYPLPNRLYPVNHKIGYVYRYTTTQNVVSARITIALNNVVLPSFRVYPSKEGSDFVFDIDISGQIKHLFPPFSNLNSDLLFECDDLQNQVGFPIIQKLDYIEITIEEKVNNILSDLFSYTFWNEILLSNAVIDKTGIKNLSRFNFLEVQEAQFLTKSRNVVCRNQNKKIVNFLADVSDYWFVAYYFDDLGNPNFVPLQGQGQGLGVYSLNIAPQNIQIPDYAKEYQIWFSIDGLFFVPFSKTETFKITENCCGLELAWINEFGGIDNHVFCDDVENINEIENNFAFRSKNTLSTTEKGIYKLGSEISDYLVVNDIVLRSDIDWVKYVAISPEVQVFWQGDWHNCVIESMKTTISKSDDVFQFFTLTIRLENIIGQGI